MLEAALFCLETVSREVCDMLTARDKRVSGGKTALAIARSLVELCKATCQVQCWCWWWWWVGHHVADTRTVVCASAGPNSQPCTTDNACVQLAVCLSGVAG